MYFKMKSSSVVCHFKQTTDLDSILNPTTKAASVEHSWPLQCILLWNHIWKLTWYYQVSHEKHQVMEKNPKQ